MSILYHRLSLATLAHRACIPLAWHATLAIRPEAHFASMAPSSSLLVSSAPPGAALPFVPPPMQGPLPSVTSLPLAAPGGFGVPQLSQAPGLPLAAGPRPQPMFPFSTTMGPLGPVPGFVPPAGPWPPMPRPAPQAPGGPSGFPFPGLFSGPFSGMPGGPFPPASASQAAAAHQWQTMPGVSGTPLGGLAPQRAPTPAGAGLFPASEGHPDEHPAGSQVPLVGPAASATRPAAPSAGSRLAAPPGFGGPAAPPSFGAPLLAARGAPPPPRPPAAADQAPVAAAQYVAPHLRPAQPAAAKAPPPGFGAGPGAGAGLAGRAGSAGEAPPQLHGLVGMLARSHRS